jgi:hypothetical protein
MRSNTAVLKTPAAGEEIAFRVGERDDGVGLAQHEAIGQATPPADRQSVHGKWIVGGEDEGRTPGGSGHAQRRPAEVMHMNDVEVSARQWRRMSGWGHLPAALAQAVGQHRLGRDGVLHPVIRRLIEDAAYNANAHDWSRAIPCPNLTSEDKWRFGAVIPILFGLCQREQTLIRMRTDGQNANSGGWIDELHSPAPHYPFETCRAAPFKDRLVGVNTVGGSDGLRGVVGRQNFQRQFAHQALRVDFAVLRGHPAEL